MYLNQIAILRKLKRDKDNKPIRNIYGEFEYTVSTIKVRKQPYVEEIKTDNGRPHMTKHIVYVKDNVTVDDIIDDEVVLQDQGMVTLGGKIIMRKVIT